jgi:hypothetical protein
MADIETIREARSLLTEAYQALNCAPMRNSLTREMLDCCVALNRIEAQKPRVPMAMLKKINDASRGLAMPMQSFEAILREIAARYGVEVSE